MHEVDIESRRGEFERVCINCGHNPYQRQPEPTFTPAPPTPGQLRWRKHMAA